jgi:hypothetical protein
LESLTHGPWCGGQLRIPPSHPHLGTQTKNNGLSIFVLVQALHSTVVDLPLKLAPAVGKNYIGQFLNVQPKVSFRGEITTGNWKPKIAVLKNHLLITAGKLPVSAIIFGVNYVLL